MKSDKLSSIVSREVMINLEIPIKHISYLYFNFKITFEKGIKMLSILTRRANTSNAMNEAEMAQELLRGGMQDLHKCCYPFKSMLKTTKKIGSRYSYCLHCRKWSFLGKCYFFCLVYIFSRLTYTAASYLAVSASVSVSCLCRVF